MINYVRLLIACLATTFLWQQVESKEMHLRDNLQLAKPGDYIVTAQRKMFTLLHIYSKQDDILLVEEISVPMPKIDREQIVWKNWVTQGASGYTSWVMYPIKMSEGKMLDAYSLCKNGWYKILPSDNFLSTLLNLRLTLIPKEQRKKVGPLFASGPEGRPLWQPKMVVDGKVVHGVAFDAWRTQWPKDGGQLSGKTIEIFTPEQNDKYPAYFPYWLQISGMIGSAKVYIIDSGTGLVSPAPKPPL